MSSLLVTWALWWSPLFALPVFTQSFCPMKASICLVSQRPAVEAFSLSLSCIPQRLVRRRAVSHSSGTGDAAESLPTPRSVLLAPWTLLPLRWTETSSTDAR